MNYLVVLFKNKERKKIINKFQTFERCNEFYNNLLKNNESVIFDKKIENAKDCVFELGLLEKTDSNFDSLFVKDNMGRQVKVEIDDPEYKIIKISNYKLEEMLFDVSLNKKISVDFFIKKYLPKNSIKLVSCLNNKIVLQNDNDVNLFSLKNEFESERFLMSLSNYMISQNRSDTILVSESSKEQKKYLYDLLNGMGIDKKILYRKSTTFKERK
jgi:hypothetical protein